MSDANNGEYQGGPNGGDSGVNVPTGSVALLSDPVDVIIDKLLRYVLADQVPACSTQGTESRPCSSSVPLFHVSFVVVVMTAFTCDRTDRQADFFGFIVLSFRLHEANGVVARHCLLTLLVRL